MSEDSASKTPATIRKLPPGVVLDENGKPCKVCNSWQTWAKATKKQVAKPATSPSSGPKGGSSAATPAALGAASIGTAISATTETQKGEISPESPVRPNNCPPDVNALGRATWTFLHTTAAYYPVQASQTQQSSMRSLLQSVGIFYPCTYCATDFRERMSDVQPDVSGRAGLSRWLCERHNEVNERLGKVSFDCDKTDERWKDGPLDGSCD